MTGPTPIEEMNVPLYYIAGNAAEAGLRPRPTLAANPFGLGCGLSAVCRKRHWW